MFDGFALKYVEKRHLKCQLVAPKTTTRVAESLPRQRQKFSSLVQKEAAETKMWASIAALNSINTTNNTKYDRNERTKRW